MRNSVLRIQMKFVNKQVREHHSNVTVRLVPHSRDARLFLFSDATLASNEDGGSQSAYVLYQVSQDHKTTSHVWNCSLLDWQSKKIRRITRSTIASETLAMTEALDNCLYAQNFWEHLTGDKLAIFAFTDSKSLAESVRSDKQNISEKRLLVEISSIREMVAKKEVERIYHIAAKYMLADSLTKENAQSTQTALRDSLVHSQLFIPVIL